MVFVFTVSKYQKKKIFQMKLLLFLLFFLIINKKKVLGKVEKFGKEKKLYSEVVFQNKYFSCLNKKDKL